MARTYELKRRAERQRETRLRIVEAAIVLHSTVGPARTSVSAIAERARVQRHTVYSHFPTELELGRACSGLYMQRHPLPDPDAWLAIADPEERLRIALGELYAYYERHETLLACVLRDAEIHDVTREVLELRMEPTFARSVEVLAGGFPARGAPERVAASVALAIDFRTWQTLVRRCGLAPPLAVETAVRAVRCQPG